MKNEEYRKIEDVIDILSSSQLVAVADIYENGIGVPADTAQATRYYKMAAEQGVPYAQYQVAMRITEEEGALLWLHSAAKQGFPTAMKEFSDRLRDVDPRASQKWLRKYYKSRDKIKKQCLGKEYNNEVMPEVIDGMVVIKL